MKMKQAWINIILIWSGRHSADKFIEKMRAKFPDIRFKLGEFRFVTIIESYAVLPVKAYLPTPHPNEIAREVIVYANRLEQNIEWHEVHKEQS